MEDLMGPTGLLFSFLFLLAAAPAPVPGACSAKPNPKDAIQCLEQQVRALQQQIAQSGGASKGAAAPQLYDSGIKLGQGTDLRRYMLGQYDVCFLTYVDEAPAGTSFCRVEKDPAGWSMHASRADCRASCIKWSR
jgi:hypothetical protein